MKLPIKWLGEFVDLNGISTKFLQEKLFSCGFEVEEIITTGAQISGVVACKIMSIKRHENADKLTVCKVDCGKLGQLQIVTNAVDLKTGDVVPVAIDGAVLHGGKKITAGEVRGVFSDGMFCSGSELGINDDYYEGASADSILRLPNDAPLGECVKEIVGLNECIFDISVTANRPDCQSILGLARETAAVLGRKLTMPTFTYETDSTADTKDFLSVEVKDHDLCPRYMAHLVKDIRIEKSPLWLRRRLLSVGIRPINNIVDITNYVLIEIGQPMHAFDLEKLGQKLVVRQAENEKLTALDDKEYALDNTNLAICDESTPVAIAGVMGGLNTSVTQETDSIILESALFKRDSVRRTSKALGLRSESSARFEKGVDAYSNELGLKRALSLISELNIGKIAKSGIDVFKSGYITRKIITKTSKINALLGIDISAEKIKQILKSLEFSVEIDGDRLIAISPLYREDIENYADLAEEVIRMYGYDKIVPTFLDNAKVTQGGKNQRQRFLDSLKNLLLASNAHETVTYSFTSQADLDMVDSFLRVKLLNPLGEELSVMRTSLIPSLLRTVSKNISRKNLNLRLFELASTYHTDEIELTKLPSEILQLCAVVSGEGEDFYTTKGICQTISMAFGAKFEYRQSEIAFMHSGRCADIYLSGEKIGFLGQVSYEVSQYFDISQPVFIINILANKLYDMIPKQIIYQNIAKFPSIERDLAIVIDANANWSEIEKCVISSGGVFLKEVEPFDIYTGKGVPEGKKSVAFSMLFNSLDKTLTDEADKAVDDILLALSKIGAQLRT